MPRQGVALPLFVSFLGALLFAGDPVTFSASSRESFVTCAPDQPTVVPLTWSRRRFLTTEGSGSRSPNLCIATADGVVERIPLDIPEVAAIGPYDAVVSPTSDIYVSAAAFDSDSRVTTFFARVSEGQTKQVCGTFPHFPAKLAAAADGTVWTAGWNTDWEQTRTVDRFVINRYDARCNLLQTIRPALRPTARSDTSQLRVSDNTVILRTGSNEIIEFSLEGKEIDRYDGPQLPKGHSISGITFAVSQTGIAAIGVNNLGNSTIWVFNRKEGVWERANVPDGLPPGGRLMGFEGEDLVVGFAEAVGQTRTKWLTAASPSSDRRGYLRQRGVDQ